MKVTAKPITEYQVTFTENERRCMVNALEYFSKHIGTIDMPGALSVQMRKALIEAAEGVKWPSLSDAYQGLGGRVSGARRGAGAERDAGTLAGTCEEGRMTTNEREAACLSFYPYADDMDSDVVTLSDRFVRAAKDHPACAICRGPVAKGERHRALTQRSAEEGKVMTFRFCPECCEAMADSWTEPNAERLLTRTALGMQRGTLLPFMDSHPEDAAP